MNFEGARSAISNTIYTLHTANYAGVPIYMPNQDGPDLESLTTPYVEADILWDANRQMGLGNRSTGMRGRLLVSYHIREGNGTKSASGYTDFLQTNIGLQTLSDVEYREVFPAGPDLSIGWYSVYNYIPFIVYNFIP